MKKNKIEFFYPILATIASIFLCTIIWDNITINYSNPYEIIGEHSDQRHSIYNDTIRYLVFVSIPVLSFLFVFLIKEKEDKRYHRLSLDLIYLKKKNLNIKKISVKYLIVFLSLILALFLFDEWNIYSLDIFEEGMPLSGSTLFNFNQKPWQDVHLNTGFFYDMLNVKISWILTGYETIGSFRFYLKFLNMISFFLIIYFLFELSNQIYQEKTKVYFFAFASIIILFIFKNADFWRDIPLLIFLISILKYLNTRKFYYLLIISFLSVFTFFWSLDRGFFVFTSLIPLFIFVLINDRKDFIKFIFSVLFFWILTILMMGTEIFLYFIHHTKEILTQHEFFNGLIHPQPFSDDPNASRATKSLLLIILNFIISIIILLSKKDYFLNNTKFLFIFFSILNFLIYKTALSRSDGGHIKAATYFSLILFLILVIFFIFNYLNKKNFFKNNLKKINIFLIGLIILIFWNNNISFKNFYSFPNNIKNLITANDEKFVDKKYYNSIIKLKSLLEEDECIQAFSYDLAIYFLLKKKSCSKFFNIWVIGSKRNQQIYIDELKLNKPKFILTKGEVRYGDLNKLYPYIDQYIENEYFSYDKIYTWNVLKKIK